MTPLWWRTKKQPTNISYIRWSVVAALTVTCSFREHTSIASARTRYFYAYYIDLFRISQAHLSYLAALPIGSEEP